MDNRKLIEEYLLDDLESLFADGFDDAILGVSVGISARNVVVYDYDMCVQILMQNNKMSHEDAVDFIEYNTINAYVGKFTPIFVKTCTSMKELSQ